MRVRARPHTEGREPGRATELRRVAFVVGTTAGGTGRTSGCSRRAWRGAGWPCRCSGRRPRRPSSGSPSCPAWALPGWSSATGRVLATRPRCCGCGGRCARRRPAWCTRTACGPGAHRARAGRGARRAPSAPGDRGHGAQRPAARRGSGRPGIPGSGADGGARRGPRAVRVAGPRTADAGCGRAPGRPGGRSRARHAAGPRARRRPMNSRLRRLPTAKLSPLSLSPPRHRSRPARWLPGPPSSSRRAGLPRRRASACCLRRRPAGRTWSRRRCS